MRRAAVGVVAIVGLCAGGLTACTSDDRSEPATRPAVVASTDVWGSVAQAVAGSDATVTSVVTGAADPHSFAPAASAVAAVTDATLVVYNGGGYDAWVDEALAGHRNVATIDAYSMLDPAAVGEVPPANEHVFYELNTAKAVAGRIADRLADADPPNADGYRSRAMEFSRRADAILQQEHAMKAAFPGAAVVATEPVAHYLLLAAGLTDKTPEGFSNAIEQDTDAAPADIAEMLDLISRHEVAAVIFNDQTVTGATRQIRDAAQTAGVPVVMVTETLPEAGQDYLTWQAETAARLDSALKQGR